MYGDISFLYRYTTIFKFIPQCRLNNSRSFILVMSKQKYIGDIPVPECGLITQTAESAVRKHHFDVLTITELCKFTTTY